MSPPLNISRADVDEFLRAFDASLSEVGVAQAVKPAVSRVVSTLVDAHDSLP